MLSVSIHKDINEYKPKMVGGLTTRTLLCTAAAVASAVLFGVFVTFVLHVDINDVVYLVWFAAAPAALIGFYQPHGLDFEKFLPLWYAHNFKEQCLPYISASNRGEGAAEKEARKNLRAEDRAEHASKPIKKLLATDGIEMWDAGGELSPVTVNAQSKQIEDFWSENDR